MSFEPVAGHDRRAVGLLRDRELDQTQVLVVAQRRRLAGRAAHDHAVGAVRAEVAQQVDERVLVDAQIVVEGRHDRRQDGPRVQPCGGPYQPGPPGTVRGRAGADGRGDGGALRPRGGRLRRARRRSATTARRSSSPARWPTSTRANPSTWRATGAAIRATGAQFAVERVRVREPEGEAAVLAYLNSIKHVGPAAPRGSSTATAPRECSRRRPRPAPRAARGPRDRRAEDRPRRCARGRSRARCARCGCSSRATASRPPPRRASTARSARAHRDAADRPVRDRPRSRDRLRHGGRAGPRPRHAARRAVADRRRPAPRAPPGRGRRPLPPPRATRSSRARGGCSAPTPRTASTTSPPPGSSSTRTAASPTR